MSTGISIIIPTFNSVDNLPVALQSIFSQTHRDFEVLIIDGQSSDGTISYIEEQQQKFPNIRFVSEKDKGIYDAMNKGLLLSKGRWIYFMGSDDSLADENVLGNIYNVIKSSDRKVIYGNVLIQGSCGWANDQEIYDGKFTMKKLFRKNICHQAIFYERSVFEKMGNYNILYKICADYDFNLRIASMFKFQYVDLIIANFNAGGASTKYDVNKPTDQNFYADRNANVFEFYKTKILFSYMSGISPLMIQYGKQKVKAGHYAEGVYFTVVGYYHRVKLKLYSYFRNKK